MALHKYSTETQLYFCNLYKDGLSAKEIQRRYSLPTSTMHAFLRRHHVPLQSTLNQLSVDQVKKRKNPQDEVVEMIDTGGERNRNQPVHVIPGDDENITGQVEQLVRKHARTLILKMLAELETKGV